MPLPSSPWYTFCPLIDSYYDELRHSLDSTTHILTNRQPIVSSMIPRAHANGCGKPPRNRDREARRRRREASRFEAKITRAAHTGDRPGSRSYLYYERAYIRAHTNGLVRAHSHRVPKLVGAVAIDVNEPARATSSKTQATPRAQPRIVDPPQLGRMRPSSWEAEGACHPSSTCT